MKKSITLASAALTALTFATVAFPVIASANVTTGSAGSSSTAPTSNTWNSTADIAFQTPTTVAPPTQPTIPVTPNPGLLALDYVSDLNFGTKTIDGVTTTFTTTTDGQTGAAPIQVAWHDYDGVVNPYTISVTNNGFYTVTSGAVTSTKALPNAMFSFPAGTATNATNGGLAYGTSNPAPFTPAAVANLGAGQTTPIITGDGTGAGNYADVMDNATLTIPVADQNAGTYEAQLNWTLTAAQ